MRELSLFTGAGGGLLGSMLLGWTLTAAVEWDAYCQRVLCARGGYMADAEGDGRGRRDNGRDEGADMAGRSLSSVREGAFPVHGDVRTFHPVPGSCDIVTGGFPCQPHSQAGKRLGGLDDRDLWSDTLRVLRESGAPLGFFENVPGLLTSRDADGLPMFGRILGDLSESGFDAQWCVLGADDVGAPHRRKRLWILADARRSRDELDRRSREAPSATGPAEGEAPQRERCRDAARGQGPWAFDPADVADGDGSGREERRRAESVGAEHGAVECGGEDVEYTESRGQSVCRPPEQPRDERHVVRPDGDGYEVDPWLAQPYVGRVAHGVASRVDRLRALGNGQVPQTMAAAFTLLAAAAGLRP